MRKFSDKILFRKIWRLTTNQLIDFHEIFTKKFEIFFSIRRILNDSNPIMHSSNVFDIVLLSRSGCFAFYCCLLWANDIFVRHEKSYFLWTLMDRVKIIIGYGAKRANCEGKDRCTDVMAWWCGGVIQEKIFSYERCATQQMK